jgi:hypothetical protein
MRALAHEQNRCPGRTASGPARPRTLATAPRLQQHPAASPKPAAAPACEGPCCGHDFSRVSVSTDAKATGPVYRKVAPAKPHEFPGCTVEATMTADPNRVLDATRVFAADLVEAALAAIERRNDTALYRTALARHFINPNFEELEHIYRVLRLIWASLKNPSTFRCAASDDELKTCQSNPEAGITEAFMAGDLRVVLCASFWLSELPCRAMFLIHEAAHVRGIGNDSPHPPYRGSTEYPHLAGVPPAGQTAALRANNPDAYAYFAAHIGRETDDTCFGVFVVGGESIEIKEEPSKTEKK